MGGPFISDPGEGEENSAGDGRYGQVECHVLVAGWNRDVSDQVEAASLLAFWGRCGK